jgi:hypothetical protein
MYDMDKGSEERWWGNLLNHSAKFFSTGRPVFTYLHLFEYAIRNSRGMGQNDLILVINEILMTQVRILF